MRNIDAGHAGETGRHTPYSACPRPPPGPGRNGASRSALLRRMTRRRSTEQLIPHTYLLAPRAPLLARRGSPSYLPLAPSLARRPLHRSLTSIHAGPAPAPAPPSVLSPLSPPLSLLLPFL